METDDGESIYQSPLEVIHIYLLYSTMNLFHHETCRNALGSDLEHAVSNEGKLNLWLKLNFLTMI